MFLSEFSQLTITLGDRLSQRSRQISTLLLGDCGEELDSLVGHEDEEDEEELLRQAIALSLEGAEEYELV